jgi:surfactin synthase thioesterase subunit
MPACIHVCPVEIPGRGRRSAETSLENVADFADILVDALPLQVPLPVPLPDNSVEHV